MRGERHFHPEEYKERENDNSITKISTGEGNFRLVRGSHIFDTRKEKLKDASSFAIESISNGDNLKQVVAHAYNNPQMRNIFLMAKQEGKPIYLVDIVGYRQLIEAYLPLIGAGAAAAKSVYDTSQEKRKKTEDTQDVKQPGISRRGILKGIAALGVGMNTGLLGYAGATVAHDTGHTEVAHEVSDLIDKLDPWVTKKIVKIRNLIMAQKTVQAWKDLQGSFTEDIPENDKDMAIISGSMHFGIEDELTKTTDERMNELRELFDGNEKLLSESLSLGKVVYDKATNGWVVETIPVNEQS